METGGRMGPESAALQLECERRSIKSKLASDIYKCKALQLQSKTLIDAGLFRLKWWT